MQAWDESFLGHGMGASRRIPADISYQLGLLTVPPSVTDVLAWGYNSPPGRYPPPQGGAPAAGLVTGAGAVTAGAVHRVDVHQR